MVETQRIFSAFRLCLAPVVLGAALLLSAPGPAQAADIPLKVSHYLPPSMAGRIAVAKVVLNRAMDRRFPPNLCDVVKENHMQDVLHRCQFSWYCDARADTPHERKQWRTSLKIAAAVLQKDAAIPDPTGGALWYHADFTRPHWSAEYETTTIIGHHIFYRDPNERRGVTVAARKPFIYRLNAFAEYVGKHAVRKPQVYASAADELTVPVQSGTVAAKPRTR